MLLAGFEQAGRGDIRVDGKSIRNVPAHRRNQGIVFQSYALFPHMSVAENVAYPLKARGVSHAEQKRLVAHALDTVRMGHLAARNPSQLSGGQQQRVALARAIAFDPPLILMDESLSALDRKLRQEMQLELIDLHKTLGKTIVYVTHDQEEAMVMSDRIAVLREGRLVQIGSAPQIYDHPVNRFVAGFMGDANFVPGIVECGSHGTWQLTSPDGWTIAGLNPNGIASGEAAVAVLRPEAIRLSRGVPGRSAVSANPVATVLKAVFCGDAHRYQLQWRGMTIDVKAARASGTTAGIAPGDVVSLEVLPGSVVFVRD